MQTSLFIYKILRKPLQKIFERGCPRTNRTTANHKKNKATQKREEPPRTVKRPTTERKRNHKGREPRKRRNRGFAKSGTFPEATRTQSNQSNKKRFVKGRSDHTHTRRTMRNTNNKIIPHERVERPQRRKTSPRTTTEDERKQENPK